MSTDESSINPAYPNGLDGIVDHMNARRAPLSFADGEALPVLDCDLLALAETVVPDPDPHGKTRSGNSRKSWEIANELKGQNALLHLNALLISHLRKRSQPDHTADLFVRLWAEHAELLIQDMDLRWKVSSLTSFGDHGKTLEQRSTGFGLSTLFGTMKLYESERLFSGRDAERPFTLEGRAPGPLPLEMDAFSLMDGGLDTSLIGRLWEESDKDPVIRPLAHDMLQRLIDDPRTVFRRLHRLRARKLRQSEHKAPEAKQAGITVPVPKSLVKAATKDATWGVVCTTNAPTKDIARFVAHHLDIGATRIYLFLDDPNPDATSLLLDTPSVELTICDAAYWQNLGKERPETHQFRQAFNATRALRSAEGVIDWLGHIDTDEFVISKTPVSEALKTVSADAAAARLYPAEALAAPIADVMPKHFKLRTTADGVSSSATTEIYPTFGSYLRGGFLSHLAGKVFARTGLGDMRLAIHRLRTKGQDVLNTEVLDKTYVGHLHAPDWESFKAKLHFRQTKGSYRIRQDEATKSIGRLLQYLSDEEGEEGLRMFFDEICHDTPDLRKRLKRHKLLLSPKFDPDVAVKRVFGNRLT